MQRFDLYRAKIRKILDNRMALYFIKLFLFIILYKLGEYTFNYLEGTQLFSGMIEKLYLVLSDEITRIAVKAYTPMYSNLIVMPGFVITINGMQTIQMMKGCTGLMQLFQVLFILLFFPISLRNKLVFIPLSILIIALATIVHYFILIPVAYSCHDSFDVFHNIISRVVFYIFFFINFVLWNKYPGK